MTDAIEVFPSAKAIAEAWDRIARTPDGAIVYVHLQRRLMAIAPPGARSSALRTDEGERRFASTLIGLMAKGIHESGGRTSSGTSSTGTGGDAEQPIVVPRAGPVRTDGGPRGAGRRITADTRVPGYDHPDDPD